MRCPAGEGCVQETRVLGRKVKVSLDDQRVMEFDAQDVFVLDNPPATLERSPDSPRGRDGRG